MRHCPTTAAAYLSRMTIHQYLAGADLAPRVVLDRTLVPEQPCPPDIGFALKSRENAAVRRFADYLQ